MDKNNVGSPVTYSNFYLILVKFLANCRRVSLNFVPSFNSQKITMAEWQHKGGIVTFLL